MVSVRAGKFRNAFFNPTADISYFEKENINKNIIFIKNKTGTTTIREDYNKNTSHQRAIMTRKFPWFQNTEEIERRKFNIRPVPNSSWFLITPRIDKREWEYDVANPFSEDSELNWRSSVINENGFEISGGLPKFMNFGETGHFSYVDQRISDSIGNNSAILTKKEDGSLIIRSVFENKVILRTRGSSQLSEVEGSVNFNKLVNKLIEEKYPFLLDPSFLPEIELYFEFVSPENRIVVVYEKEDLVFIHAKIRENHRLLSWDELEYLAKNYNLNLVETIDLNCDNALELRDKINSMEKDGSWPFEGIVVRSPEGFMSKIKGEKYLAQHQFKAGFNYGKMVDICETHNISDFSSLKKYLEEDLGFDWEAVYGLDEMFSQYQERKQKFSMVVKNARNFVSNNNFLERKDFALAVKNIPCNSIYFALLDGREEKIKDVKEKMFNKIVKEGE